MTFIIKKPSLRGALVAFWLVVLVLAGCGGQGQGAATGAANAAPVARILASSFRGLAPLDTEFSATRSSDSDGSIVSYAWDFGDGTGAEGAVVQHLFTAPGTYGVSLTVTDNSGAVGTELLWLTVLSTVDTFSLYGTVSAQPYMDTDGDTNDPAAPQAANNGGSSAEVQVIGNPVILNGFLTLSGTGVAGDAFADGADVADVFAVTMEEGQYVSLQVVAPLAGDIDLYLLSEGDFDVLASSSGTGQFESLRVPAAGQYYVMVRIASGTSSYVLKVGDESLVVGPQSGGQSGDFEPLAAVVKFKENAQAMPAIVREGQLQISHSNRQRECLARFNPANPQAATRLQMTPEAEVDHWLAAQNPRAFAKFQTLQALKRLRGNPEVAYAEPNYRVKAKLVPNDSLYGLQWHYPVMNLPQAWDITTGAPNVTIAVVDSGVYPAHPELRGQLLDGYDFIAGVNSANDGDGLDPDPTDPGDDAQLARASWHGTHVTGALVAQMNNRAGIAGVTPGAKVMPLRVLGVDGGSVYDVLQAVRYAAGLDNDSGLKPAKTADIINLSLGGPGYSQAAQDLYQRVRGLGIFVVAAAGNDNSTEPMYPASYAGVVSVSAFDFDGNRAYYSNQNNAVDVAAPGGDLTYDRNRDGYGDGLLSLTVSGSSAAGLSPNYAFYQGTSIAAPHVAGIIALMKAVHPGLTPAEFDSLLISGAISHDKGAPGFDPAFGYGAIDALLAVQAAAGLADGGATAAMIATPAQLVFDSNTSAQTITVAKLGSGELAVIAAEFSEPWLDAVPVEVDAEGFGTYNATVNREGLAQGNYTATLSFLGSNGSALLLGVNLRVGDLIETGNAGRIYIMLLDAATDATIASVVSDGSAGEYPYRFDDVPVGDYYLVAGSDVDHDGNLCTLGEICGYYPSFQQRSRITLLDDKADLNFVAGLFLNSFATEAVSAASVGHQLLAP